jgi:hypothetical protein
MTQEEIVNLAWDFAISNQLMVVDVMDARYVPEEKRSDGKPGGLWLVRIRRDHPKDTVSSNPFYCIRVEDRTGEAVLFTWP